MARRAVFLVDVVHFWAWPAQRPCKPSQNAGQTQHAALHQLTRPILQPPAPVKTLGKTQLFGSWACSRCGRLHLPLCSACMLCKSKLAKTAVLLHTSAATPCQHTGSEPLHCCCLPHRTNLPPAWAPPRSGGHAQQADSTAFSLRRLGDPPRRPTSTSTRVLQVTLAFLCKAQCVYDHSGGAREASGC